MGRFEWIIIVVTIGIIFWGCESSGPTGEDGGGGGGGPFPGLVGDWVWQHPLPQGNDLMAVDFFNTTLGLAVGSGGTIIRTTNGGSSWNAIAPITAYTLSDVKFIDQQTAFAIGYGQLASQTSILHTDDGGANWSITELDGNGVGEVLAVGSANVIYAAGEASNGAQ